MNATEPSPSENLERRLLPLLTECATRLSAVFDRVKIKTFHGSVGKLTEYQGHHVGIDCLLPVNGDECDNIGLEISIRHIDVAPELDSACVVWGHPSGYIEAELLDDPRPFSSQELDRLVEELPALCRALETALKRGRPP